MERNPKDEPQLTQPSAQKRKRDLRKHSITAVPVSAARSQADPSHLSTQPFVPTNKIPVLSLPPSRNSPVDKVEPLRDPVPEVAAYIGAIVSLRVFGL